MKYRQATRDDRASEFSWPLAGRGS